MAFLKTTFSQEVAPVLRSGGVALRPPAMADYAEWAELRTNSRHHLEPWEPAWAADELTRWAFRRRIRHYQRESRDDQGYAFFIVRADDDRLIGGLTLSNVRRGVTQAANLKDCTSAGTTGTTTARPGGPGRPGRECGCGGGRRRRGGRGSERGGRTRCRSAA